MATKKSVQSVETIESMKEKGEKILAESSLVVTTDQSNVVAVQYPATVDLGIDDDQVLSIREKYSHLKQLAVDDKKSYRELVEAIKDVKKERTSCTARENAIKEPLNAFRALVISTAKKITSSISAIEDDLKAEKQRIDDIVAEQLAAQQRLWTKNLQLTMNLAQIQSGMNLEQLEARLKVIESFDIESLDFGDQLEQAKANKANAHAQVMQAIAMEKQRVKLEEEAAKQRKEAADAEEKRKAEALEQAEKDRIQKEAADAQAKKIAELEAMLAAASAPKESEPELEEVPYKKPESEKRIGGYPVAAPDNVIDNDRNDYQESPAAKIESAFDLEEDEDESGENDKTVIPAFDADVVKRIISDLDQFSIYSVLELKTEEADTAVSRVIGQTVKMSEFLKAFIEEYSL